MPIRIIQEGTKVLVQVHICSPSLGDRQIPIQFLLDTGADTTTISPRDAANSKIDFDRLSRSEQMIFGVGGAQDGIYEMRDVTLAFAGTDGRMIRKALDSVDIVMPGVRLARGMYSQMPSLMGRDVLAQMRFLFNSRPILEDK